MADRAVIFNEWQSYEVFREQGRRIEGDFVYTESPYLYEKLSLQGIDVFSLANLIEDSDVKMLSENASRITGLFSNALDQFSVQENLVPVQIGKALGRILYLFVNVVLFRAAQWEKLLSNYGKILVPVLDKDPQNQIHSVLSGLVPFQCNYFSLFCESGIGSERAERFLLGDSIKEASRRFAQKTVPLSFSKWLQLFGLRILGQRSQIWPRQVMKLARKFTVGLPCTKRKAYVYTTSDFVYDVFGELLLSGYGIREISFSGSGTTRDMTRTETAEKMLVNALNSEPLDLTPVQHSSILFAAKRLALFVAGFMLGTVKLRRQQVAAWKIAVEGERPVVITNGIYDPEDAVLTQLFGAHQIPVASFEHGGMGLTEIDRRAIHFSDKENCSHYVAHNAYEEDYYRTMTADADKPFYTLGISHLVKPRNEFLSRKLARSVLRVKRQNKLAVYAPTRFREDSLWIGYETQDIAYWRLISKIISEAFSKSGYEFFVKMHQKGWLPSQKAIYDLRKHPLEIAKLPSNVSYGGYPQLNYLRWAADLIIIDRASSTIQWALTHSIPMVYLNFPFNPLETEVRRKMDKAVFVFDIEKNGEGLDAFCEFLNQPHAKMMKQWQIMRPFREEFLKRYVLGPTHRKRNFAKWLDHESSRFWGELPT